MKYVSHINQGNKALEFIDFRISDINYRGARSSQHNRYTMQKIVTILKLLDKYSPDGNLMQIRTVDIKKRPYNLEEENVYAEFCNEAKNLVEIGTQDAMRKNLFVDLHRMGLLERYDKNKKTTNPFLKQSIKYVSLTNQGLKLIKAKTILEQYFIFSKAIDSLLGGFINILLNILRDDEYKIESISIYEFMFFVSAIDAQTNFEKTTDECIELIKQFRNLSSLQKKAVIETLKDKLRPKNYTGNKLNKRDFHNWLNKAEQIYSILNQTVYFEVRGELLVLKDKINSFTGEVIQTQLSRSLNEKYLYFKNHNIEKEKGFELHHVIPLSWSESIEQFKLFDKWENMVYIDAYNHAKITQNRNRNVIMDKNENDIILRDFSNNEVYLSYITNISYKIENQQLMLSYNSELLKTK